MNITPISNIFFRSGREDRHYVQRLSDSTTPLNENLKNNIDTALQSLSQNPSDDNIRFLLSTAQNLSYGIPIHSDFRKRLLADSPLKDKPALANTDWESKLRQAAQNAIQNNNSPNKRNLEEIFKKTFENPISISGKEVSILDNRRKIIQSRLLQNPQDSIRAMHVRKNLDYFIFSSEVSTEDKAYCLEKLANFISNKYKINPQLKDKKLQVLDEILNDIIIKTPEDAIVTIKEVNQKRHGMCAAIAGCRKLLAYTDKKNYLTNILEELNASPDMKIYDITQLGSGIKVPVEKVFIDFEDALKQNYRIIDASALQWMQNASRTGDGNIVIRNYVPFDERNYEIYADSFWLANFPEGAQQVHEMLQSAIKARKLATEIHQTQAHLEVLKSSSHKTQTLEDINRLNSSLEQSLSSIFTDKTPSEIKSIAYRIINLQKGNQFVIGTNYKHQSQENPIFIIHEKEPDEIKKEKIKNFLLQFAPTKPIEQEIDNIFYTYDSINNALSKYGSKINKATNPEKMSRYYQLLFEYATAYQDALERNLNEKQYADRCLSIYKLDTRRDTILNHFQNIINELNKEHKNQDLTLLAKLLKSQPNREELLSKTIAYKNQFEQKADSQYLKIIQMLGFKDKKELVLALLEAYKENISANDKEEIALISNTYKVNPTKFAALKHLNKMIAQIEAGTFKGSLDSVMSDFNIKDDIAFLNDVTESISTLLENPDAKVEEMKPLYYFVKGIIKRAEGKTELNNDIENIKEAINKLDSYILSVENKFNVPTSKDVVLAYHRKKRGIINADEFDILEKKFKEIRDYRDEMKFSEAKVHNPRVFTFSAQEKEILRKIEKYFNSSEKYVNKLYTAINRTFKPELNKIYNESGRQNGDFWTIEEGSGGLFSGQEIKILEQMTGRPFHAEHDLLKVIEAVKQGNGGGQISTNVCDDEFSGHAQYLYAVSPIKVIDEKTKKEKLVDAIWHDNSWGKIEYKDTWRDANGNLRTDYSNGTGGKDGFLVRNNGTTGWLADYALYGKGVHHPEQIDNPIENKYYKYVGTEYALFDSVIIPGQADDSKEKAMKLAKEMLDLTPTKKRLKALFSKIEHGEIPAVKSYGEKFDSIINGKIELILKRIQDIKTEEDFNKLPEDDVIKLVLKKIALEKTSFGTENKDYIDKISTSKEIDEYNKLLLNKLKLFLYGYLGHNSMLAHSNKIKGALLDYLTDYEKDHKLNLGSVKSGILKALRVQDNELNQGKELNEIVIQNISNLIDSSMRFNPNKEDLKSNLLTIFNTYYASTFSTETILKSEAFAPLLKAIDKKFNPESDEDVKNIINKLRGKSRSELNAILKDLSLKDFGIQYQSPYHLLKIIQAESFDAQDTFHTELFTHFAYEMLPEEPSRKVVLGNIYDDYIPKYDYSINSIYRSLVIDLSYAEIEGIINKHREEYLQKYSIRPSFPDVKYHSDNNIHEVMDKNLETIRKIVDFYKGNLDEGKLLSLVEEFKSINFEKIPMTEEYYNKKLFPLFKAMYNSSSVSDLGKDCVQTMSSINNAQNNSIQEKYKLMKLLSEQLAKLEPVFNKELLEDHKSKHLKKLKEIILGAADGFIAAPNQKANMIKLLKYYVKEYSKNASEEKLSQIATEIKQYSSRHYVLKQPTLLLDEIIKLKLQDKKNGTNTNKEKIEMGIRFLEDVLDSSHKTEVECKILDEINSGRIYDLKKNLKDYKCSASDGTDIELLSDRGIYLLFDSLYSRRSPDPMSTINLLCQHSGLSDDFCRVLAGKFEINKFKTLYLAFRERLLKVQQDVAVYRKICDDVIATKPTDYNDAIKAMKEEINKQIGSNSKTLKSYMQAFDGLSASLSDFSKMLEQRENLTKEKKEKITAGLLKSTHQKALNNIVFSFQDHLQKFNDSSIELEKGIDIIKNLKLNKFSPQVETQQKLLRALDLLKELGYKIGEEAENTIEDMYVDMSDNIQIVI